MFSQKIFSNTSVIIDNFYTSLIFILNRELITDLLYGHTRILIVNTPRKHTNFISYYTDLFSKMYEISGFDKIISFADCYTFQ